MGIEVIRILDEQPVDSPYVEKITHGYTDKAGNIIRPADTNGHIVISKQFDKKDIYIVGPWSSATPLAYSADTEIIWIRIRLGTRLSATPTVLYTNHELLIPHLSDSKIEYNQTVLSIPDFNDIDLFIEKLTNNSFFSCDRIINDVMAGSNPKMAHRTLRKYFLNTTGLSRERIYQIQRSKQAWIMLKEGSSIHDVITELGYYDQSHLTNNLRRYLGLTPGQIVK
jgi:hypothetical protein